MFLFVFKEDIAYRCALSGLDIFSTHFSTQLVGDLVEIRKKRSGATVLGLCPVDFFRDDIERISKAAGYQVLSVSLDDLAEWASKVPEFGQSALIVASEMKQRWTSDNQNILISYLKEYAKSVKFL